MSKPSSNNDFWAAVAGVILAGVVIKVLSDIFSESKTEIISEKGMKAINDPEKKKEIDAAFERSAEEQKRTGVWKNPVVDLD